MPRILLIDDDQRLADLLRQFFARHNLTLASETLPSKGLVRLERATFDLVILDVMLPEMDGFEVCRAIRKDSDIPIIMLTARGEVMDRVVGLELGADDYLPKPFEPRELVARIHSILKRIPRRQEYRKVLRYDELTVDTQLRQVTKHDKTIDLSAMEYQLLELLTLHPGQTYTRDELLNHLKGIDADVYTRSIDILVSRVRQKLKPLKCIKTVRGSGYCFIGRAQ